VTHRGPFQPRLCCDSVILYLQMNILLCFSTSAGWTRQFPILTTHNRYVCLPLPSKLSFFNGPVFDLCAGLAQFTAWHTGPGFGDGSWLHRIARAVSPGSERDLLGPRQPPCLLPTEKLNFSIRNPACFIRVLPLPCAHRSCAGAGVSAPLPASGWLPGTASLPSGRRLLSCLFVSCRRGKNIP